MIQQKGHASTEWDPNAILLSREIGIETDTNKMKIGDGITPWGELEYINNSGSGTKTYEVFNLGDGSIDIIANDLDIDEYGSFDYTEKALSLGEMILYNTTG